MFILFHCLVQILRNTILTQVIVLKIQIHLLLKWYWQVLLRNKTLHIR